MDATKWTARKLFEQKSGKLDPECSDRVRIMPLAANATSRGAGSRAEFSGCVGPVDRLEQRGKNGFSPLPGSRMRRCTACRDDEIHASRDLRNGLIPVLASALHSHAQRSNDAWLVSPSPRVCCRPEG